MLVIFDVDGVLVDSEPISLRELTRAINELGVRMTQSDVEHAFKGGTLEGVRRGVEERKAGPVPDSFVEQFVQRRDQAFRDELRAIPGAREAVEGVRREGHDVCVASQGRVEKTRFTLGLTGLLEAIDDDAIFSATMVPRPKPAPDLFVHAAATRGFEPGDCVVVEDTETGVAAANAAGMRVLHYGRDFHDMREVPRLLR